MHAHPPRFHPGLRQNLGQGPDVRTAIQRNVSGFQHRTDTLHETMQECRSLVACLPPFQFGNCRLRLSQLRFWKVCAYG